MSTQNDLLDGNDSNLERLSDEAPEQSDMCLNWQDDVDNNFPNCEPDACGDYCGTTAPRYLEVLEFTHFVTMFEFDGNGENYKNKKLIDRITVSVVLDLGCGNTTENVYESE